MSHNPIPTPNLASLEGLFVQLFSEILRQSATSQKLWPQRMSSFKKHGLTSFYSPTRFPRKEIEVEQSKLDEPRYRRQLIRKLKAPRPSKYDHFELQVDRERLLQDDKYVADISTLFAYKWTNSIKQDAAETPWCLLVLCHLKPEHLLHCLDNMGMHQVSGQKLAELVLRTTCDSMLDKNEKMKQLLDDLRQKLSVIRAEAEEQIASVAQEHRQQAHSTFARLDEELDLSYQSALQSVRENARKTTSTRSSVPFVPVRPQRDVDWWMHPPKPWSLTKKVVVGSLSLAGSILLAFHLEVNGTTPAEAIGLFYDWLGGRE